MFGATSEYALWALIALTRHGGTLLARELADETGVPVSYLAKILTALRRAGILESTRGARGGFRLARDPDTIRLIDVIDLFEATVERARCVLGNGGCDERDPCGIHDSWQGVWTTYTDFLEQHSVGELARASRRSRETRPASNASRRPR